MELTVNAVSELDNAMPEIVKAIGGRRKIALYGDMGAGKTTFTNSFCRCIGVKETTGSPTFSIINAYHFFDANGNLQKLHHLDLYRLRSAEEVFDVGVEDVLYDPWYCLIEWPQHAEIFFPDDIAKITFEITGPSSRKLIIL